MAVSTAVSQVCHRLGVCREDVALHPHQPLTSTLSLVLLCVSNRVSRILARTQSILINCFFLTIDFTNTVTTAVGVYTNWFEVNFEENYYILYHSLSIHLFLRYDLHWCMCVYLFFDHLINIQLKFSQWQQGLIEHMWKPSTFQHLFGCLNHFLYFNLN